MKKKLWKKIQYVFVILYVLFLLIDYIDKISLAESSTTTIPNTPKSLNININNESKSDNNFKEIFSNIIVAGSTIGAVVITHLFIKKREERKLAEERDEEIDFNKNIREMIFSQLNHYKQFIYYIQNNSKPAPSFISGLRNLPPHITSEIILIFQQMPNFYLQLGIERRTKLFYGEALFNIDQAFISFNNFIFELTNKNQFTEDQIIRLVQIIDNALSSFQKHNSF
jgi:hypothetical protein